MYRNNKENSGGGGGDLENKKRNSPVGTLNKNQAHPGSGQETKLCVKVASAHTM